MHQDQHKFSDSDRHPVEVLAEEFAARYRAGERPSIADYVAAHPTLAEEIEAVFPSISLMEECGSTDSAIRERERRRFLNPIQGVEQLGDFRIVREIGRGGMGVVYEAIQESLGRRVALKVLNAGEVSSPRQLERFRREALAAASLHHTNIVPVFGAGEANDSHFYVMQLIDGRSLEEVMLDAEDSVVGGSSVIGRSDRSQTARWESATASGPGLLSPSVTRGVAARQRIPIDSEHPSVEPGGSERELWHELDFDWRVAVRLVEQLAEAVDYAHSQHVLHRDIKPANILVDQQGTAWLADFGLAKHGSSAQLTRSGDFIGTLRYMAPEQFAGQCSEQSDIYSLGVTLQELCTRTPAFSGVNHGALIKQITSVGVPRLRTVMPEAPRDLETILQKATRLEAESRYATAGELARDLRCLLLDEPISARRVGAVERLWRVSRRNPALSIASTACLVLLLLFAITAKVGNIRTNRALEKAEGERRNAEAARLIAEEERSRAPRRIPAGREKPLLGDVGTPRDHRSSLCQRRAAGI